MKAAMLVSLSALALTASAVTPVASGSLGIYAIVERVAFEPNEQTPQRLRVYGAFAFVNGGINSAQGVTAAQRGMMYFTLKAPVAGRADSVAMVARREWNDIKSVAGTGQAIGFGQWFYFGQFGNFRPDGRGATAPQVVVHDGNDFGEMRVRAVSDTAGLPAVYETNVGVVKLGEASHARVITALRAAIR
jgi:hypothetical protein